MAEKRTRNWTFIVYPDSVPFEDWQHLLKEKYHIPMAVSPLHDKDLNPTGDEKKPHWHVYLEFASVKSYSQVKEITDEFNATIPQSVQSPVGMIRYFIHKDNPEKYQYDWKDISIYNGFDLEKYDTYTESEQDHIIVDILQFIDANDIMEYSDLLSFCADRENEVFNDWFRIVRRNTILFDKFITSRRHKYKEWQKILAMRNCSKQSK